jgi:nucleoside-diphosphate-sugar epimerase
MRILVTGVTGQVSSALVETLPSAGSIIAADRGALDPSRRRVDWLRSLRQMTISTAGARPHMNAPRFPEERDPEWVPPKITPPSA